MVVIASGELSAQTEFLPTVLCVTVIGSNVDCRCGNRCHAGDPDLPRGRSNVVNGSARRRCTRGDRAIRRAQVILDSVHAPATAASCFNTGLTPPRPDVLHSRSQAVAHVSLSLNNAASITDRKVAAIRLKTTSAARANWWRLYFQPGGSKTLTGTACQPKLLYASKRGRHTLIEGAPIAARIKSASTCGHSPARRSAAIRTTCLIIEFGSTTRSRHRNGTTLPASPGR